jgi:hypothetical protein
MVDMNHFLNKNVKVIFDDGDKITMRVGKLISVDDVFLYVENEAISIKNVVRVEVVE